MHISLIISDINDIRYQRISSKLTIPLVQCKIDKSLQFVF